MRSTCEVCKEIRNIDDLDVRIIDISKSLNLPIGTTKRNLAYCKDNPNCKAVIKNYDYEKDGLHPKS